MSPLGANIYQNFIHLAIQGVLVPQWAVGATLWATSRSIQFWTFCVHNQPTLRQWHVYLASQCVMCPQWALWDHHTSTSCTSSHSGRSGSPVSLGGHYMNHIKIQDQPIFRRFMSPMSPRSHFISMSYTSSRSMHYVSPLSLGSHQASTPFTFSYFGYSKSIGATIWTASRSIHFQTFFVPSEPREPLSISVMYF